MTSDSRRPSLAPYPNLSESRDPRPGESHEPQKGETACNHLSRVVMGRISGDPFEEWNDVIYVIYRMMFIDENQEEVDARKWT